MKTIIKSHLFIFTFYFYHLTLSGQVKPAWEHWIKKNSFEISLSDTTNFDDLAFLKQVLKDKSIVFLGESSHGVSEFTQLKSRMIRYLHKELGFDVLAFEDNAADALAGNMATPVSDALTSIHNTISMNWHVEEIVPLFHYIKETHATNNPLEVAGVDISMNNGSFSFSRLLYNLILPIDSMYARVMQKSDSIYSRIGIRFWKSVALSEEEIEQGKKIRNNQQAVYEKLIQFFDQNQNKFSEDKKLLIQAAKFYLQSSRIDLIKARKDSSYMVNKMQIMNNTMDRIKLFDKFREFMMTQNLKFLTTTLYPGKKIIVWAHNSHVRRSMYKMSADSSWSGSAYTIGFLSYSGQGYFEPPFLAEIELSGPKPDTSFNKLKSPYHFKTPTDSIRVENIMHSSKYENTFVDMLPQEKKEGNSWMFENSKFANWDGSDISEEWNFRNAYDGLILVDKTSPPKYLNYKHEYMRKK